MKKTQEFSGKDVDTAVRTACSVLSVSKKELKYDVISTGASGIFGIVGRKDAIIKVFIPQNSTDASEDDMEGIRSMVDEAFGEDTRLNSQDARKKQDKTDDGQQKEQAPAKPQKKPDPSPEREPQPEFRAKPETAASPPQPETDSKKTQPETRPKADKPTPRPKDDAPDSPPESPAEAPVVVDVTRESIDLGILTLQKMADLITEDAVVEAQTDKDHLTLKISGGNAGILIGRKGQTLDAMQFLTDKIINRKSEARVRVKVDVEGYTETRKSNLRHLAVKMAEKAKKTGRPATINQMSAQDRRIVHLALKDDNRVRTQSMGDGYYRRLVIFPKKKNSFAGKKRFKR
ncbi:MAG: R3H domain-containing nucleic acid-binding protein [Desulfotignum sp.]|jgi:spoIIIJ-associated protein|nr:R3H domain-containing nucleic acid-binding protein [Desulfotignum sp.]